MGLSERCDIYSEGGASLEKTENLQNFPALLFQPSDPRFYQRRHGCCEQW